MKYSSGTVTKSLSLKFLEQLLTKGTSLVVSIVLARLLDVEDFGVIAILTVFTSLCSAIIEGGLSTSLIQMKEVDDEDYSTVFYTSGVLALLLYGALFLFAPLVASFYNNPQLSLYLRVIGLTLFATPFNATQLGYVYRNMLFRHLLISTAGACILSGAVGIVMAKMGAGVWALVAQTLGNSLVAVALLFCIIPWKPKLLFSVPKLKKHFSFGWKLLISSLVETLYIDLQALVLGKKYSSNDLAYFNRGDTYPKTIITSLNTAVQTVMFPVLSAAQDSPQQLKALMRKAVSLSSYLLFPVMAGFAAVGKNFVTIVLTEKWLPCVIYLQLACISYAIRPINSCNLQALKAIGRSDIFLWLTLLKKTIGIAIILVTAFCFETPLAIAIGVALYAPLELFLNASPNQKLIGYTLLEQIKDIFLPMLLSLIMFVGVTFFGKIPMNPYVQLVFQIILGMGIYLVLSLVFRVPALNDLKQKFLKRK